MVAPVVVSVGAAPDIAAGVPVPWKNCAQVNKRYPHGVGRIGARDKTSGTPVTFKRSDRLYTIAMKYNKASTAIETELPARAAKPSDEAESRA